VVVREEALLAIVDRIYESVERPELWPATISAIGELIGGRRHFWGLDQGTQGEANPITNAHTFETGCYGTFFLSRADLQTLDQYAEEFGELIIVFLKIVFLSILRSQKEVAAREAIGLRMTQRYLQSFGPLQGTPASSVSRAAGRKLIAAFWEDGRFFSSDSLRSMRVLAPHLDRAMRLQMRLSSADLRADMVSGALDCLTHGVVLVNSSGLPIWLNRRAQEITKHSDALRMSSSGFAGRRPSDTQSLRELIKGTVSAGTQGLLAISRGDDSRPLLLIAIPLKPIGIVEASNQLACGVVFISDPDRTDDPSVESLRRAFELTYREAQTAIAIAHGQGLQAAANSMGVALTTVRSQLQQAFAKTGTSHQAELAALVQRTLTHVRYN
jgi:DNA-binding CsgD family transcriptional regulator/PAS domain-containing protein